MISHPIPIFICIRFNMLHGDKKETNFCRRLRHSERELHTKHIKIIDADNMYKLFGYNQTWCGHYTVVLVHLYEWNAKCYDAHVFGKTLMFVFCIKRKKTEVEEKKKKKLIMTWVMATDSRERQRKRK